MVNITQTRRQQQLLFDKHYEWRVFCIPQRAQWTVQNEIIIIIIIPRACLCSREINKEKKIHELSIERIPSSVVVYFICAHNTIQHTLNYRQNLYFSRLNLITNSNVNLQLPECLNCNTFKNNTQNNIDDDTTTTTARAKQSK